MRALVAVLVVVTSPALAGETVAAGATATVTRELWGCDWQTRKDLDRHLGDRDAFRGAMLKAELDGTCTRITPGTSIKIESVSFWSQASEVSRQGEGKRWWVTTPVLEANATIAAP